MGIRVLGNNLLVEMEPHQDEVGGIIIPKNASIRPVAGTILNGADKGRKVLLAGQPPYYQEYEGKNCGWYLPSDVIAYDNPDGPEPTGEWCVIRPCLKANPDGFDLHQDYRERCDFMELISCSPQNEWVKPEYCRQDGQHGRTVYCTVEYSEDLWCLDFLKFEYWGVRENKILPCFMDDGLEPLDDWLVVEMATEQDETDMELPDIAGDQIGVGIVLKAGPRAEHSPGDQVFCRRREFTFKNGDATYCVAKESL